MNKAEIYDYLKAHQVSYEAAEHPAVYNMEEMSQIDLPHPEVDAKNLFVRDDKKANYYLITVKGDKRVNLKEFRHQHSLRNLSFASEQDLMEIMGLIPGAVTPLGLLNDTDLKAQLYLDRDFLGSSGLVGVHPNDNTATIYLQTQDLIRLIQEHSNKVEIVEI
jgi:Ala-tRNA(Pro) deacylase